MHFHFNRLLTWAFPFILVGAYVWSAIAVTAATPIRVGEITDVKGSGWGVSLGNVKYDKVGGDTLVMDEVVATGLRSAMTMQFVDKTVMTLGPNAEITIDEMVYNPDDSDKDIVTINLGKGTFYFVSGLVAKEKVTIVTPTTTIGIRGTELVINVKEDGTTSVGVAKGHAFIRSRRGGRSVEISVGYTGTVSKRGKVSKPFPGIDLTGEDDVDRKIPGVAEWLDEDEKDEEDEEEGDVTEFSTDKKDDEDEKSADDEDKKKSDDAGKDDGESDSDETDSSEADSDESDSDEGGDGGSGESGDDGDGGDDGDSGDSDDDGAGNDSNDSGTKDRTNDDDDDDDDD